MTNPTGFFMDGRERKVRQQDRIVPVPDDRGRVVDFHSLRGSFATRLAQAGVKPLHLKRLMRHASIRTTDRHYTDLQLADLAGAVRGPTQRRCPAILRWLKAHWNSNTTSR